MREETNRKYRYDLRIKRDKAKQDEQRSEDSDSAFKVEVKMLRKKTILSSDGAFPGVLTTDRILHYGPI